MKPQTLIKQYKLHQVDDENPLLNSSPGPEITPNRLAEALGKKKFVGLLRTVLEFGHALALLACGLRVFDAENKTKDGLCVFGNFPLLSSLRIGRRVNVSNEMPAVLVRFVHLHGSIFIKE